MAIWRIDDMMTILYDYAETLKMTTMWWASLLMLVVLLLPSSQSFPRTGRRGLLPTQRMLQTLEVVQLDLPRDPYPVYIGTDLLQSDLLSKYIDCKKVMLVSNDKVGPLYCQQVREALQRCCSSHPLQVFECILPDGEQFKTMTSVLNILDASLESGLDRKSMFVALGGGVVGDVCGFAASIFQRGVRFVQIPTSLMAMVDSSVGGKTGVNHSKGKNLIGSFHQPAAVFADLNMLDSLPRREYLSGLAEVVKYGLIRDEALFQWLETNTAAILARDEAALRHIVSSSCRNKAAIVALDELESTDKQIRMLLNLGHTFGHAIETCAGYGRWLHGEAVSVGMVMAADLSQRLGLIPTELFERIKALLRALQLPISLENTECPSPQKDEFLRVLAGDKKSIDGSLSLVLLRGDLGQATVTNTYDRGLLGQVVQDYCT